MAEPVSAIAGIIALADLVIKRGLEFGLAVAGAPKEIQDLLLETKALKDMLQILQDKMRSLSPSSSKAFSLLTASQGRSSGKVPANMIDSLRDTLQEVNRHAQRFNPKKGNHLMNATKRVAWPLIQGEVKELQGKIDSHKHTIQLAISIDKMDDINSILLSSIEVKSEVKDIKSSIDRAAQVAHYRAAMSWLSKLNQAAYHADVQRVQSVKTGHWFTSGKTFEAWLDGELPFIWLHGGPGTGKTVLGYSIIEELIAHNLLETPGTVGNAYHYCSFKDEFSREPKEIIGSLLKQMCYSISPDELHPDLEEEYLAHTDPANGTVRVPRLETSVKLFKKLSKNFQRFFVVLDGVDECSATSSLTELLQAFTTMPTEGDEAVPVSFLILSRSTRDLEEAFEGKEQFKLGKVETETDIKAYTRAEIGHYRGFDVLEPTQVERLIETLAESAEGRFKWIQCQIAILAAQGSCDEIFSTLENISTDLNDTYDGILSIVPKEDAYIARRMLIWLTHAIFNLTVPQLQDAIAILEFGTKYSSVKMKHVSWEKMQKICGSLISLTTTESGDEYVNLSHYTVKEWLLSPYADMGPLSHIKVLEPTAHDEIATACLSFLILDDFGKSCHDRLDTPEFVTKYPLLDYAMFNWHIHYEMASGALSSKALTRFLPVVRLFSPGVQLDKFRTWYDLNNKYLEPLNRIGKDLNVYDNVGCDCEECRSQPGSLIYHLRMSRRHSIMAISATLFAESESTVSTEFRYMAKYVRTIIENKPAIFIQQFLVSDSRYKEKRNRRGENEDRLERLLAPEAQKRWPDRVGADNEDVRSKMVNSALARRTRFRMAHREEGDIPERDLYEKLLEELTTKEQKGEDYTDLLVECLRQGIREMAQEDEKSPPPESADLASPSYQTAMGSGATLTPETSRLEASRSRSLSPRARGISRADTSLLEMPTSNKFRNRPLGNTLRGSLFKGVSSPHRNDSSESISRIDENYDSSEAEEEEGASGAVTEVATPAAVDDRNPSENPNVTPVPEPETGTEEPEPPKEVTFADLKSALKEGEFIFQVEEILERAYKITSCRYPSSSEIEVSVVYEALEGEGFFENSRILRIHSFFGTKPVADLIYKPKGLLPTADIKTIEEEILERTSKLGVLSNLFNSGNRGTQSQYQRPFHILDYQGERILIDKDGHGGREGRNPSSSRPKSTYEQLSEEQKLTCSPFVIGFWSENADFVRSRFAVDDLQETIWESSRLEDLSLPPDQYEVIASLADSCYPQDENGEGAMLLLSGESGTGKTATAVAVAEYLGLLLNVFTSKDIHLQGSLKDFSRRLQNLFEVCSRWGVVMLFEDFDILVKHSELSNAVPLILELAREYPGLTIFTSREPIRFFARAVSSRIDICLEYDALSPEVSRKLWHTALQREEKILIGEASIEAGQIDIPEDAIDKLACFGFDGHQIENAARTARKLARRQGRTKISLEDLERVKKVLIGPGNDNMIATRQSRSLRIPQD